MTHAPQTKIAATYMRGGTSKGVFFKLDDLPESARVPGAARDALLMRVIGSPDPYGKQIDGMGAATSSTSKTVIIGKSTRPDHDVDYLFGQVSIDQPFVDWSGNCGNLSARSPSPTAWSTPPACRRTASPSCASGRPTSRKPSSRTSP
jgi:2-methylaconitate cis-trans-isomerase PrpF